MVGLVFGGCTVGDSLAWGHRLSEREFLRNIVEREILSVETQISIKEQKCRGILLGGICLREFVVRFVRENNIAMQRHRILRGNTIWKKHREEGKNSLFSRGYSEFCRVITLW